MGLSRAVRGERSATGLECQCVAAFVDVPTAVTFHVRSRLNRAYTIEAAGSELDYYLIAGTPKEILATYTELTSRPAVPPEWALGLWASTCFVQFTEDWVIETARLYQEGTARSYFTVVVFALRGRREPDRVLVEVAQAGGPERRLDRPGRRPSPSSSSGSVISRRFAPSSPTARPSSGSTVQPIWTAPSEASGSRATPWW